MIKENLVGFGMSQKMEMPHKVERKARDFGSPKHKVYGKIDYKKPFNLDLTSDVVNDSTLPIFLNRFSYDQNGQLNFNANATYGVSFLCSPNNASALGNKEINSSIGTDFIFISSNAINISNSSPDNFDLDNASALCRLISVNNRSGAIKSSLGEKIRCSNLPAIKEDITMLASTTNNIQFNSSNFFLYFLYSPPFTFLPNSSASFSESFDLATIDLNNANSAAFLDIAFLAISDQFISGNESISCFKSSGIANVNVGILNPPLTVNASNYVYYVRIYKCFVFDVEMLFCEATSVLRKSFGFSGTPFGFALGVSRSFFDGKAMHFGRKLCRTYWKGVPHKLERYEIMRFGWENCKYAADIGSGVCLAVLNGFLKKNFKLR